jgi:23S rRNA pseudouridine2605 synthase
MPPSKAGKTAAAPPPPGDRIAKVLARAGVASRRDAERMIAEGRVAVNGQVIDSPALNVGARDRIEIDGTPLPAAEPPRLWLYHKPAGVVTTARDELDRTTIYDVLPEGLPRVMPVGRLDLSSEGLLLLTNDGGLKRRLELPSTGWLRRYRVRVNGRPDDAQLQPLRDGITIEREAFQPMTVTLDRQQGANAWLTVGLREGRNREVRRAMEAVGLTVNRLIRVGYGPFRLAEIAPGAVEEVRPKVLRDQLGLAPEAAEPEGADAGAPKRRARGPGVRPAAARSDGRADSRATEADRLEARNPARPPRPPRGAPSADGAGPRGSRTGARDGAGPGGARRGPTEGGRTDAGRPDAGRADAGRADAGPARKGRPEGPRRATGPTDNARPDRGAPKPGRAEARPDSARTDSPRADRPRPDTPRPETPRTGSPAKPPRRGASEAAPPGRGTPGASRGRPGGASGGPRADGAPRGGPGAPSGGPRGGGGGRKPR